MPGLAWAGLLLAGALQPAPARVVQQSTGWCSPNIANVTGNVTVNCIGVDPRALQRLNAQLSRRNIQLAEKIREADEWTSNYKELEEELAKAGDENALSRQAAEYLHQGELEKAGEVLDQILGTEDKETERAAANHYSRGLIFELQFQPVEALPHFAKAYELATINQNPADEVRFGRDYGTLLAWQNDLGHAETVARATLEKARELAKTDPGTYRRDIAEAQNALAMIYIKTQRFKEGEAADEEALAIFRELAKAEPAIYEPYVAKSLNDLAQVYYSTERFKDAEAAELEALQTYRDLAKSKPATYEPQVASVLGSLAIVYRATQRMKEAEATYAEALGILRRLAASNAAAYQPTLAVTLSNEALFYYDTNRMAEGEAAGKEALGIQRQLMTANPDVYRTNVANTLNILGLIYSATQQGKQAEPVLQEALTIRRQLAKENAAAYLPDVAETLGNLAYVYMDTGRLKESEAALEEALAIRRKLASDNPEVYQPQVGATLSDLALFHMRTGDRIQAAQEISESIQINHALWKANPAFAGDGLAGSLLIAVDLQVDAAAKCELAIEAGAVAYDPHLKDMALKKASVCVAAGAVPKPASPP